MFIIYYIIPVAMRVEVDGLVDDLLDVCEAPVLHVGRRVLHLNILNSNTDNNNNNNKYYYYSLCVYIYIYIYT